MSKIMIYGPAACGKTRNAKALAAHYGARQIVDGFNPPARKGAYFTDNGPVPADLSGALILTNLPRDAARKAAEEFGARAIAFDHAMKEARL